MASTGGAPSAPAGYPPTEETYAAPVGAAPPARSPPLGDERYAEYDERHWGHFGAGLGLSFFFSLLSLFGLFFIKMSQQKKFFLYGCAVGITLNILLVLILWFLGFAFLSILVRS